MNYDPLYHPYASRRSLVYGAKGMVATSQPLAAQAGLDMLKQGGNAIDAAIATAACLTVVEPSGNGIGSDAFALVWVNGKLHGLNASGTAPQALTIEALRKAGHDVIPKLGMIPVIVPGAPSAWAELSNRFGRLPFTKLFQPAIEYAENGYPVSPIISKLWASAFNLYKSQNNEAFKHWFETFAPEGRPIAAGEMWRSPGHAATLRSIAETKGEAFYRGELAEKIEACAKRYGGFLAATDLAAYHPEWVEPIKAEYRGYEVCEIPPNGQGLVALMALNILKAFEFPEIGSCESYHKQIEAVKLAFADCMKYITDPRKMKVAVADLLSEGYAADRRSLIGKQALTPEPGNPPNGGTVYLATADDEGNMVSYIQSNFWGFGSGMVVPGTGISLQNRGFTFSTDPNHVNCLEPGKRTYHTIIPGFLLKDGNPVGPFGIMGGYIQPQAHVQVVMNAIDFGLNPQASLDAPRWQWTEGKRIEVEAQFPEHVAEALQRKGHNIVRGAVGATTFGRGQIIWRNDHGVLTGATEPRTDGTVAAW